MLEFLFAFLRARVVPRRNGRLTSAFANLQFVL